MKSLQEIVVAFVAARDWKHETPGGLAKSISIEAAELLEHFQWHEPSAQAIRADATKNEEICDELADVLIYALQLANVLGVTPEQIVNSKLEKCAKRYPPKEGCA